MKNKDEIEVYISTSKLQKKLNLELQKPGKNEDVVSLRTITQWCSKGENKHFRAFVIEVSSEGRTKYLIKDTPEMFFAAKTLASRKSGQKILEFITPPDHSTFTATESKELAQPLQQAYHQCEQAEKNIVNSMGLYIRSHTSFHLPYQLQNSLALWIYSSFDFHLFAEHCRWGIAQTGEGNFVEEINLQLKTDGLCVEKVSMSQNDLPNIYTVKLDLNEARGPNPKYYQTYLLNMINQYNGQIYFSQKSYEDRFFDYIVGTIQSIAPILSFNSASWYIITQPSELKFAFEEQSLEKVLYLICDALESILNERPQLHIYDPSAYWTVMQIKFHQTG